jgi:hypothetical protein
MHNDTAPRHGNDTVTLELLANHQAAKQRAVTKTAGTIEERHCVLNWHNPE